MDSIALVVLPLIALALIVYMGWLVYSINKDQSEYNRKVDMQIDELFPLIRKRREHEELMCAKRSHEGKKP